MSRLPLVLLLLLSLAASAAEVPVSELTIVPGRPDYGRLRPVVIGGEDSFLVFWTETYHLYGELGALGRAYDADGNPFQSWASISLGYSPQVVWTGEEYLVIAAPWVGRFGRAIPDSAILVKRLRRDGSVIAQRAFLLTRGQARVLSLAWNGMEALALADVDGRRLLTFDREGNLLTDTPADADIVAVAPKGNSFLLLRGESTSAIAEGDGRYAAVRADAIAILDEKGRELERVAIAGARTVAWDGTAWHTAYIDADSRVCRAKFTAANDVQRDCRFIAYASNPAIGAIPRRTLMAWESASNQIVTDAGMASTTYVWQYARASAVDATGLLLVWWEDGMRIGGFRYDGTPRERFEISTAFPLDIDLAVNGDRTLLVWRASDAIEFVRLDTNGQPVEPRSSIPWGTAMRVVALGDGWLIVRESENAIIATRASRAGVVIGEQIVIMEVRSNDRPGAAATAGGALVASTLTDSNEFMLQPLDVYGAPAGSPLLHEGMLPLLACGPRACIVSVFRSGDLAVMLVSHDGRALTELAPLERRENLERTEVTAQADGTFRVYLHNGYTVIGANGQPRGWMPIGAYISDWGGVEEFRGRTWLFYSYSGRAYVRDLPPKTRAVRH